MKGYVEFTGKTLDEAIKGACEYFGVPREKLEIEIVNDAKSGIFGLVGAKKATLRARRVQLQDIGLSFGEESKKNERTSEGKKSEGKRNGRSAQQDSRSVQADQAGQSGQSDLAGQAAQSGQPGKKGGRGQERRDELQIRPEGALEVHKTNLPSVMADESAASGNESADANAQAAGNSRKKKPARGEARGERVQSGQSGQYAQPEQSVQAAEPARRGQKAEKKGGKDEAGRERARQPRERGRKNADEFSASRSDARGRKSLRDAGAAGRSGGNGPDYSDEMPDFADQLPVVPLESVDQELLQATVMESLQRLVTPIVGEIESSFVLEEGRVRVQVRCADNCGLLIGRDGQTLAALQYILSCIASRKLNVSVRVQIDAGDYREKQDEKLRELALSLAQKVKSNSRPQSTRPLSAYHRRIIHMTLQDDPHVQTHSKGEGGLKRVVVVPRRK